MKGLLPTVAMLALFGCTAQDPVVSLGPPASTPGGDYENILSRWTRSARVIKELDTTLRVHATLFSPEFVEAFVARHARVFKLSAAERSALREKMLGGWQTHYPVTVAAAMMDINWNDFEQEKSVWRVTLINDEGDQVKAEEIRPERKVSTTFKDFFPYIGRFHRVYQFTFPKVLPDGRPLVREGTKRLALRFAGPLGLAELTWRLR